MSQSETAIVSSVVAVYPDHAAAERGAAASRGRVRARRSLDRGPRLAGDGETVRSRQPRRLCQGRGGERVVVRGAVWHVRWSGIPDAARAGPRRGGRSDHGGGLAAGVEGAWREPHGQPGGALVGWGVPNDRAIKYEEHVKGGRFLVVVRSVPEVVARATACLPPMGRTTSMSSSHRRP